jgi:hypothetical protein
VHVLVAVCICSCYFVVLVAVCICSCYFVILVAVCICSCNLLLCRIGCSLYMLLLLCHIGCCLCMLLLLCRIQAIFHTCNSLTAIYPNRIRRQDSAVPNPCITYHLQSFFFSFRLAIYKPCNSKSVIVPTVNPQINQHISFKAKIYFM